MVIEFVICLLAIAALCACVYAGYSDFTKMNIPNIVSVFIVMSFGAAFILQMLAKQLLDIDVGVFNSASSHAIAFVITFVVTFIMFALKGIGGGDAKLATALSAWLGVQYIMPFLTVMAVAGGVLGILSLCFKRYKPFKDMPKESWIARAQAGESVVPYGIALCLAAIFGFHLAGYLPI